MKTRLFAATAVTLLAFAPFASAAFAASDDQPERHARFTAEDRAAFLDARIAGLKAGLALNPDQEKNWPAFESTIRDLAKERAERFKEWRDARDKDENVNAMDRLSRMSDRLSARAADIKKLEEAAKPLFDSLDDGQKRRFGPLLAATLGHGHRQWRREG
jgi:zinc resistance-associated protein